MVICIYIISRNRIFLNFYNNSLVILQCLIFFTEPNSSNAEPMTIGSPVSSPKSKTNASQNYLPPYLVGEVASSPVSYKNIYYLDYCIY